MGHQPHNPVARAWALALDQNRRAWWSYALHLAQDPHDAEDLVHNALATMIERAVYPDEVAPGYVYRVIRNAHITRTRRERSRAAHKLRVATSHVDLASGAHKEERLTEALASLTDEQREVITLKHAGGLTLEQIALATGRPLGTVAGQHRRAIEALRTRLASNQESNV